MKVSRRDFLKSLASIALSTGFSVPAFVSTRKPYVDIEDTVSYLGPVPGGFIGSCSIKEIGKWDGLGYPVVLRTNFYPSREEIYYDVDLFCGYKEIPDKFWRFPENHRYPNIHTWLRVQRFGETIEGAIKKLNYASSEKFLEQVRNF